MNEYATRLAHKLSKATSENVTPFNMIGWLEGGRGFGKVDRIVKRYLGPGRYAAGENTARMVDFLEAVLDGKRTTTIGGMRFTNLQNRK